MRRISKMFILIFSLTILLCGCNNTAKKAQIISDINEFGVELFEKEKIEITDCEIIKRQTNKEDKEDIVYCKLFSKKSYCDHEFQYKLTYNFYDEGGWILDDVTPEKEDKWKKVYLDAKGNDIMEDIVWLKHTPGFMRDLQPLGEAGGKHYFIKTEYPSGEDTVIYTVYDESLQTVFHDSFDETNLYDNLIGVIANDAGELRFVLMQHSKDGSSEFFLIDSNSNIISEKYENIIIDSTLSGLLLTVEYNSEGRQYGTMDYNGNVVTPLGEKSIKELAPKYRDLGQPKDLKVIGEEEYISIANGIFYHGFEDVYLDINDEDIFDLEYDHLRFDNVNCLFRVYPNRYDDKFSLYDLNGARRSSEFTYLNHNNNLIMIELNGKVGLLPLITTNEEYMYFKYYWGLEKYPN